MDVVYLNGAVRSEDELEILVTGPSGFVGGHFVENALREQGWRVHGVVRSSSVLPEEIKNHSAFSTVLNNPVSLRRLFESQEINAVVHLATEYGRGNTPVAKVLEANLALPIAILDLCREFGCGVFVNMDSYFNKPEKTYSHLSNYALSKKSLSNWFPYYSSSLEIYNVILEHVYGPRDSPLKFVPSMVDAIAVRKLPQVPATLGYQSRDFIHVDDVVSAVICLLKKTLSDERIEPAKVTEVPLGTGSMTTIREFCNLLAEISKSESEIAYGAIPMRADEISESQADTTYLNSLGWHSTIDLASGLNHLVRCEKIGSI
jgi:CDP-paratose synthetase